MCGDRFIAPTSDSYRFTYNGVTEVCYQLYNQEFKNVEQWDEW